MRQILDMEVARSPARTVVDGTAVQEGEDAGGERA
jgi:hypothetical protein